MGYERAKIRLAFLYIRGNDVKKNPERAASLLREVELSNDAYGLESLARVFLEGILVDVDARRGMNALEKAAELGHSRAQYDLARYIENDGERLGESAKWYLRSLRQEKGRLTAEEKDYAMKASINAYLKNDKAVDVKDVVDGLEVYVTGKIIKNRDIDVESGVFCLRPGSRAGNGDQFMASVYKAVGDGDIISKYYLAKLAKAPKEALLWYLQIYEDNNYKGQSSGVIDAVECRRGFHKSPN